MKPKKKKMKNPKIIKLTKNLKGIRKHNHFFLGNSDDIIARHYLKVKSLPKSFFAKKARAIK